MTAAQMKKMMEGVVLFGTARRAILEGYTIAGKTGTAQKVDPQTGVYSKTKYVASFIGFTPVNTPAITIAVILDSPVGLHQGGQVCAPVFKRIAQQVLEYLHVPHDLDMKNPQRQALLATAKDSDLTDESPDHLGAPMQDDAASAKSATASATQPANVNQPTAIAEAKPVATAPVQPATETTLTGTVAPTAPPTPAAPNGTVILDVESGTVVPSFLGKPLRSAVEIAQQSGLEINAIGSGIAREQWPAPGSRLPSGEHITVRFGH
jgi:cell division protein FtsI (penicillin-binding protein 3)